LLWQNKEKADKYVGLFGCKEGKMPFRYLGTLMSHKKIANSDWREVEEMFQKKLSSWKGKLLSVG
jgi:hypothetical protein